MIQLNQEFVDKITYKEGKEGITWLKQIENIIEKYQKKLQLENIKLFPKLTTNIIFEANSQLYGKVIIKLIFSSKTFQNEVNFIINCNSPYIVKCFYYNLEDKIIVLEKITPATSLNLVTDRIERISIFYKVMQSIINPIIDKNLYRDYFQSFMNKANNQTILLHTDDNIKNKIKTACNLYHTLDKLSLPKYVLHRDLHHYNILKDTNTWKAIDPQGVIGYSIFEFPQFIKSELNLENNDISKINDIVESLSNYTSIDNKLIYMALYIDTVEKILYYISINADKKIIDYNLLICNETIKNI